MAQISGYAGASYQFDDYFEAFGSDFNEFSWNDTTGGLQFMLKVDGQIDRTFIITAKKDIPNFYVKITLHLGSDDSLCTIKTPQLNEKPMNNISSEDVGTTEWIGTYGTVNLVEGDGIRLDVADMMEYDQVSYIFYFSPEASKTYRVTAWVADNESSISRLNICNNKAEWFTNEVGFSNGVMTLNIPLIDEQGKEYDKSKYLDVGFIVFVPPVNIRFTSSPQVSINGDTDYFKLHDTRGDVFSGYFNKDCLYVLKFANTLTNNGVSTRKRNQMIVLNV